MPNCYELCEPRILELASSRRAFFSAAKQHFALTALLLKLVLEIPWVERAVVGRPRTSIAA